MGDTVSTSQQGYWTQLISRRLRVVTTATLTAAATLVLTACGPYGGATIEADHQPYNESVVGSLNQQLLLNLVRLKYRDNPYFIEIGSVTASHSVSGNAGISADIKNLNPMDVYKPSLGASVRTSPTVSYTPLRGEAFLKRLLSPIELQTLLTLVQSGWSVSRVFGVAVEKINQIDNATAASGPTPSYVPEYQEFQELAVLLRDIQRADALKLGLDPEGKFPDLLMRLDPHSNVGSQKQRIKSLLGVPANQNDLKLRRSFLTNSDSNFVRIKTRSLMGVFFYLSHAIPSPPSHIEKGLVTVTHTESGAPFNWEAVTGHLLEIEYQEGPVPPNNAFVYTRYRDTWFYIRDDSHSSKATFMLLTQLLNIQSGDSSKLSPALTIGVN